MRAWFLAFLFLVVPIHAAETVFSSGEQHVVLFELFTSEGCSSCPPAERWLGQQAKKEELWRTFVPVSWHVDYWNRLGWPDRFSTREFTQRQYDYVKSWRSNSVYTPCFVRDGSEWQRGGRIAESGKNAASPMLTVRYNGRAAHGECQGADPTDLASWELHVVLLGGDIASKVTAGENGGETLRHDFVALRMASGGLGEDIPLSDAAVRGVGRYALAAWITRRGDLQPIQATGGWLK